MPGTPLLHDCCTMLTIIAYLCWQLLPISATCSLGIESDIDVIPSESAFLKARLGMLPPELPCMSTYSCGMTLPKSIFLLLGRDKFVEGCGHVCSVASAGLQCCKISTSQTRHTLSLLCPHGQEGWA